MTQTFKTCAQGDLLVIRRDALPDGLTQVTPTGGRIVVTHSETGHDHVMVLDKARPGQPPAVEMYATDNPLIAWLRVNRPTSLDHLRPHDTHAPILFSPGVYEIRRQREHAPEGWRQVAD